MRIWETLSCLSQSLACCWISAPICALDKFTEHLLHDRYHGGVWGCGCEERKPTPTDLSLWSFQNPGTERKSRMGASDGSHLLGEERTPGLGTRWGERGEQRSRQTRRTDH